MSKLCLYCRHFLVLPAIIVRDRADNELYEFGQRVSFCCNQDHWHEDFVTASTSDIRTCFEHGLNCDDFSPLPEELRSSIKTEFEAELDKI
jgi:hypothetical protein